MRTTTSQINGWKITSVYEDEGLTKRWFTNLDICVLIERDYDSFKERPFYWANIKILNTNTNIVSAPGETPLDAFRWAREDINRTRSTLAMYRPTQHYGTRRYHQMNPTSSH